MTLIPFLSIKFIKKINGEFIGPKLQSTLVFDHKSHFTALIGAQIPLHYTLLSL